MNILIAIDSFKGSLSTTQLADTIEMGIKDVSSDYFIKKIPIADGGEGTYETLVQGLGGTKVRVQVKDPLFNNIYAEYGILNDQTAIIEMAKSSGLTLVPANLRNPLNTSTFGVGQMIKDAIYKGSRNFIIGIGGSATNDAGIGMLSALGYVFKDETGNELIPKGSSLSKIKSIDSTFALKELSECEFLVACDVDNPLYGELGAAYVYGAQKGASIEDIKELDYGLQNFSSVIKETTGKNIAFISGSGAAGGLGGGFLSLLNSKLAPGIDIIFDKFKIIEDIKSTATMYKEDFEKQLEKLPIAQFPKIKPIVVPAYNMPGGRSRFFRYIWNLGTGV